MDNNIEIEEVKDTTNDIDIITCIHLIPISCVITDNVTADQEKDPKTIANTYYLCKDVNNELFMINRITSLKDEEERLSYECLPFAEYDTDFVTRKIETRWINSCLERITTNLQFYVTDDYSAVYTYGISSRTGKKKIVTFNKEVFMGLLYVDRYPLSDEDDNEHDLGLAVTNMAKPLDKDAKFFKVGDVKVISIADATYREEPTSFIDKLKIKFSRNELVSTNIAVILKLIDSENPDVSLQLLAPFDIGVVFDESKYKGNTINSIQENYLKDETQYVANLTVFNAKLYGINETYTIIRGNNKSKDSKLFLLNDNILKRITDLINNY